LAETNLSRKKLQNESGQGWADYSAKLPGHKKAGPLSWPGQMINQRVKRAVAVLAQDQYPSL
jgi:hypothetical protein